MAGKAACTLHHSDGSHAAIARSGGFQMNSIGEQCVDMAMKVELYRDATPPAVRGAWKSLWKRRSPTVMATAVETRYLHSESCEVAMTMTVREAIRLVENDGWVLIRQKGSHRQFHHTSKPGTVTIAGKPSLDLDKKTERSILRQAGLL